MNDEDDRWPRCITWPLAFFLSGIGWWLLFSVASMLTGCAAPPSPVGPLAATRIVSADRAFQAPIVPRIVALLGLQEAVAGNQRFLPAKSSCRPRPPQPLPYILPQLQPPRAGEEWRCRFVTSVLGPEPDVDLWLFVSLEPPAAGLPAELSPIGMPGCVLQVNPSIAVHIPPGFPSDQGLMLSREAGRGRVLLRWPVPAGVSGLMVWLQVLVGTPNTPAGFLTSHALVLTVGS